MVDEDDDGDANDGHDAVLIVFNVICIALVNVCVLVRCCCCCGF